MGWNPIDDITDAFKSGFDAVGNFFTDPLGALEDAFNSALDILTFGTFSFVKDSIKGFVAGLIPEQDYQDRKRSVRGATEPQTVIYGKVRTGGQLVYIEDDGKDNVILWQCYVLAGHQVEEIEAVYADGVKIAESNGPGVNGGMVQIPNDVTGDNFFCWSVHGNRATAFIPRFSINYGDASYNYDSTPPNWTSSHRLTFQSYVWIALAFDKETFGDGGLPKFTFDVKGKNDLYDPRTDLTGYSNNHAVCVLDVLRWQRMFAVSDTDIDFDAFENAANIADELVASGPGTTEKRYTVNGTFKLQATPLEIISSMSSAGAAITVYTQGKWSIVPGAYSAPVMSLDESDLIGGLSFQPGPGKNNRHNRAVGTYIDPEQDFEAVGFTPFVIQQYIEQDREELEKSYDFAWTNSGTMARRLAKIDIERNRFGASVSLVAKFKALQLAPGDRINLNIDRLGWNPKIFRVESVEVSFSSGVKLELREDAPEIYEWEEGDVLAIDQPPVINIPNGVTSAPPEGLTFEEELYQAVTRAAIKVRLIVSWNDQPSAIAYDIQFKLQSDTEWLDAGTYWQNNKIEILDVKDQPYDIRVRSINGIGVKSDWTQAAYTVIGKAAPPPDVPLLFVEKRVLKWTYPDAPLDLAGFFVRFQNGDRRFWSDATPAHEGIVTETLFDVSEFSGQKTFLVKAVDTTGNVSNNAAVVVQQLGDVPLDNVIVTQNEAPTWTSTPQTFDFYVKESTTAEPEQFQVVSATVTEDFQVVTAATFTGAFINGDGYLEGQEIGTFYGATGSQFYSLDNATEFYSAEYERIEYTYFFTVDPADEGADLSVEVVLSNGFNESLTYIPPGYTGDPLAFPGVVSAQAGTYQFTLVIPQQQLASPPIIEDVITRLDVPDVEERLGDVSISAVGTRLPIVRNYRDIVVVSLTLQDDGGTAITAKVLDKDETLGPLVEVYDDTGTAVSGTIDAIIQGF